MSYEDVCRRVADWVRWRSEVRPLAALADDPLLSAMYVWPALENWVKEVDAVSLVVEFTPVKVEGMHYSVAVDMDRSGGCVLVGRGNSFPGAAHDLAAQVVDLFVEPAPTDDGGEG